MKSSVVLTGFSCMLKDFLGTWFTRSLLKSNLVVVLASISECISLPDESVALELLASYLKTNAQVLCVKCARGDECVETNL